MKSPTATATEACPGACLPTYKLDSLGHLIIVEFWALFLCFLSTVRGGWLGGVVVILHRVPCTLKVAITV
jgi:hypothetical protein